MRYRIVDEQCALNAVVSCTYQTRRSLNELGLNDIFMTIVMPKNSDNYIINMNINKMSFIR